MATTERDIMGGLVHGPAIAEQNLVRDAVARIGGGDEFAQLLALSTKPLRRPQSPVGSIPGVEVDLGDMMPFMQKAVGKLAEERRANALQEKK